MNELLQIPYPEFDYLALMNALRDYRYPRDRVTKLLASGRIVRVKKGLYILGDKLRAGPFSREILANLIYGPSYISLEYALSYHQMIPEWVRNVTSVTSAKNKSFTTPVGVFTYRHLPVSLFTSGVRSIPMSDGRSFLIATPEKAIADILYFAGGLSSKAEVEDFLFENMRIDEEAVERLDVDALEKIVAPYKGAAMKYLPRIAGKRRA
ncbi:MAG TPA: hypothetical protein VLM75_05945 [Spirochaetota bacterium]|nr:hypothetical protein [Spirochaetota bacterium]